VLVIVPDGGTNINFTQLATKLAATPELLEERIGKVLDTSAKNIQTEWQDDFKGSSNPGIFRNTRAITIEEPNERERNVGTVAGGRGRLGLAHLATEGMSRPGGHRANPSVHAANEWVRFVQRMENQIGNLW